MNKKSIRSIDQKKVFNDAIQKEKPVSTSHEHVNLNVENYNRSTNFLKNVRDEKSSKVKTEVGMHNQMTLSPLNEGTKHNNRYCFDSETKNFKKNIDKFKMEHEDDFVKHLDKDFYKYNPSTKRSASANNSPYKEKKRKFFFEKTENNHEIPAQGTTHLETDAPHKPIVKKIFYSYFEPGSDDRDEIREIK